MRRKITAVLVAGGSLAVLALGAGPAHASSNTVVVSLTSNAPTGGRTLNLYDSSGASLSSLDLSSGTNSFEATVTDTGYSQIGFTVTATMSNLYGFSNGQYNCNQMVPSSKVTMNSSSSLLQVAGLSSGAVPTFNFNGNLTSVLGPTLLSALGLGSANVTNMAVTGLNQNLTQAQLAGGKAGQIIGSSLQAVDPSLPVSIGTSQGSAFTNPAADPAGANCGTAGTSATNVPVENGTTNTVGLASDLTQVMNSLASPVTATTLVNDGWVSASAVLTAVSTTLGVPLSDLTPLQSSILAALTPTVSGVGTGQVSVSGQYSATPVMTVNPSAVPAGSYQGVMTVTLADTSS